MKIKDSNRLSRRRFIGTSAAAISAFNIIPRRVLGQPGEESPSDKLNIGCVGVAGMWGGNDVRSVSSQNIYALCDVDSKHLEKTAADYPGAKKYRDFREMLDKEHKNLDAITVTIPDHMHATVAIWAMERGLHVYCQKPMAQTIWEARQMTKAAETYGVKTQMGNQGFSSEGTRLASEIIWSGAIGDVTEVHSRMARQFAGNVRKWPEPKDVPANLNWDVWLGRAQERPYYGGLHPVGWRGYFDFGTQMIGDWAVHMLGPAYMGLMLDSPSSVECTAVQDVNPVTYPSYSCRIDFPERACEHTASGKLPPVSLFWYEGKIAKSYQPPAGLTDEEIKNYNTLFLGTKTIMGTSGRGTGVRLLPKSAMEGFQKPEPVLERVAKGGHHENWISACKSDDPAVQSCSNFSVARPYVEWLLMGTIACRFPNQKLEWNSKEMRFTNNDAANAFIKPTFRKGWELPKV